ncbi:hypothetical protein [Jeotgalibacillus marinus]|uniref:Secreted protein n=1 Tax=Jeotgalibacillus marinus TaxID=86667 RepID=A0ABV3Q7X2_9BACL
MKTLFALCVTFSMFGVDYVDAQEPTYEDHNLEIVDTNETSEEPGVGTMDQLPVL